MLQILDVLSSEWVLMYWYSESSFSQVTLNFELIEDILSKILLIILLSTDQGVKV